MTRWSPLVAGLLVLMAGAAVPSEAGSGELVSVFESGGISDSTRLAVDDAARGRAVLEEHRGTMRLMAVERNSESIQEFSPGFGAPMSIVAWDLPDGLGVLDRDLIGIIRDGGVVMSERSAALRGAQRGDLMTIEGWNGVEVEFAVGALVSEEVLNWAEIGMSIETADRLGFERISRLHFAGSAEAARTLREGLGDAPIRVTGSTESRDATDFVMSSIELKERFGEFSFRPLAGDRIDIDDAWVDEHIVDVDVPTLGPFRCHRLVVPYVRSALADLERSGLLEEIDSADFQAAGGCFNARLIRGGDKGFALSRHSWGVAIDINPSTNRYDDVVTLSDEFGQTFRDWGFAWGAGWLRSDGMHFEWTHVSVPESRNCSTLSLQPSVIPGVGWTIVDRLSPCE